MCAYAQGEVADEMEKTRKVQNFRSGGGREERRQYAKNFLLKMVMIVRVLFAISENSGFQSRREMLIAVNSTNHQHGVATPSCSTLTPFALMGVRLVD